MIRHDNIELDSAPLDVGSLRLDALEAYDHMLSFHLGVNSDYANLIPEWIRWFNEVGFGKNVI
jgi:hypothetical protein